MTVKELIEKLKQFDDDMPVVYYDSDFAHMHIKDAISPYNDFVELTRGEQA